MVKAYGILTCAPTVLLGQTVSPQESTASQLVQACFAAGLSAAELLQLAVCPHQPGDHAQSYMSVHVRLLLGYYTGRGMMVQLNYNLSRMLRCC